MIEFPIEPIEGFDLSAVDKITPRPPTREYLEGLLEFVGVGENGDLIYKPAFTKEQIDEKFKAE